MRSCSGPATAGAEGGGQTHAVAGETRTELLRRLLADEIVDGRLQPGIRLDEQELAARFGVSRTPVREVLRDLAASGLIDLRPRRGAVVAALTPERLADMFEMLRELEALAARLAAQRMSPGERRALEMLHRGARTAVGDGDGEAYERGNVAFHAAIIQGSHNAVLIEQALAFRQRLRPFSRGQFRLLGRLAESFAEHEVVLAALLRGDGEGAEAAMRLHVATVSGRTDTWLERHGTPPTA